MEYLRQSEIYSADRMRRLAILRRGDGYFQISEEKVRSYKSGDEYNPTIVEFPKDGALSECSIIYDSLLDGLFGSAADAENEARRMLKLP